MIESHAKPWVIGVGDMRNMWPPDKQQRGQRCADCAAFIERDSVVKSVLPACLEDRGDCMKANAFAGLYGARTAHWKPTWRACGKFWHKDARP